MPYSLDSSANFSDALGEVDYLLSLSESEGIGSFESQTLVKSAVLLLMGKFENFLELLGEQFIFALNQERACARHMPLRVVLEHSLAMAKGLEKKIQNGNLDRASQDMRSLSQLWGEKIACTDISVECKFSYGKHGEKEVVKMFRRLGVEDVFDVVSVTGSEASYDSEKPADIDMRGIINSLTNLRNNILHQDANPELTAPDIVRRKNLLVVFANLLQEHMQEILMNVYVRRIDG